MYFGPCLLQIINPELRELLGLRPSQRVWHSVRVVRLKDGISHLPVLVVSQVGRVMPRLDVDYVCVCGRIRRGGD